MTSFPKSLPAHDRKQLFLLVAAVIALYLPAVWGPINAIDDPGIMRFYGDSRLGLADVLSPAGGYYYRPLIALSFYLDYHLLAQNSCLLHLENVLLHAANAALLFLFARRMVPAAHRWTPLAAALIFALHPVNTEAVNWIAGRTDPLAALFVLLSALALCRGLETGRGGWSFASVLLLLLGALAKETALFMVPASFLLVNAWLSQHPDGAESARRQRRVLAASFLAPVLIFTLLFWYRALIHGNSVTTLLKGHRPDLLGSVLLLLKCGGFYLKMMVAPWPLNVAIDAVATWHLVPALGALLLLCRAPRKNLYFSIVCMGLLFLVPPLAVALFDVAWTQVAERYLYIPSLFLSLGLAGAAYSAAAARGKERLVAPLLAVVLITAAAASWQRTSVWGSNLTLYRDAVSKSPNFAMLHNTLAAQLAGAGRVEEAQRELNLASALDPSELLKRLIRRNRILLMVAAASPEESRRTLNLYRMKPADEDTEILDALRKTDVLLIKNAPAGVAKDELARELIEVNEALYARSADALLLYNNGQLQLGLGERKRAAACFRNSLRAAPEGAYYRPAAARLAETLGGRP